MPFFVRRTPFISLLHHTFNYSSIYPKWSPQSKPLIHEEVRTFPSRGAVTDVSPQELKEEFRSREFRLLEVLTSLQSGHIADNSTLLEAIDKLQVFVGSMATTKYRLSHDGRELVSDLESLLCTLREFIAEKNQDEVLQKIAFHSALAARGTSLSPVVDQSALTQANAGMMTLVRLLLSNPNFRGILGDMTDVVRAAYGANGLQSAPKERLTDLPITSEMEGNAETYRAAPVGDDSGIIADTSLATMTGQESMMRESTIPREWTYGEPIMTQSYPPERKVYLDDVTRNEYTADPSIGLNQNRRVHRGRVSIDESDYYYGERERDVYDERDNDLYGDRKRNITYDSAVHSRQTTAQSPTDISTRETNVSSSWRLVPSRVTARVRETVPPTTRHNLVKRLRALLRDLAADQEYQDSIGYLISVIATLSQAPLGTSVPRHVDANVYSVAIELKRVLEALAGVSMTPLLDAIFQVIVLMRRDPHLTTLVEDVRVFLERCLRDPTYLDSHDFTTRVTVLQDRGRAWSQTPEMRAVVERGLTFVDALRNDRITRALARDFSRLYGTLFYAPSGRLTFKGDLINDLRAVMLPAILAQMRYIALPRIEHRDENMVLILDNVILTSANFLPNLFELEMVNRAQMSPRTEIPDRFTHVFSLNAYQIQCDVHDVSFYYRKRTGFPRVTDWGVLDLAIAGEGISVAIMFEYDRHGLNQTLVPLRVRADVDEIHVKVHHSKHDMLFRLASPVIKTTIRRALITNIEQTLLASLLRLDGVVTGFKNSRWMQSEGMRGSISRRAPSFLRSFVPGFIRGTHHYEPKRHPRHRESLSRSRSQSLPRRTTSARHSDSVIAY